MASQVTRLVRTASGAAATTAPRGARKIQHARHHHTTYHLIDFKIVLLLSYLQLTIWCVLACAPIFRTCRLPPPTSAVHFCAAAACGLPHQGVVRVDRGVQHCCCNSAQCVTVIATVKRLWYKARRQRAVARVLPRYTMLMQHNMGNDAAPQTRPRRAAIPG